MNTSQIVAPLLSSANIRMDVRLDTLTGAKVEELAIIFNRSRAPVLRQVMRWGVRRGYAAPVDEAPPSLVRHLFIMADPNLHQQVHEAAKSAGVDGAPWLSHWLPVVTREDLPQSWQGTAGETPTISPSGRAARQSHDSRDYGDRFMLQLDSAAREKLQALADHFATS